MSSSTVEDKNDSSKAYMIGGIPIMFPCRAYPSQITMMDKIIKCLNKQYNCLLESPTGSGKSLALLCACLSWQRKVKKDIDKLDAELEENLNACGAALYDNDSCPVHHKLQHEENTNCCQNDPKIAVNVKIEKNSVFSPNEVEVEAPNANLQSSSLVPNISNSSKIEIKKDILFFDDDYEDFIPSKKYRSSICSQEVPLYYKLGPNTTNIENKPNSNSPLNQRLKSKFVEKNENLSDFTKLDKDRQPTVKNTNDISYSTSRNFCTCKSEKQKKIGKEMPNNTTLPAKLPTIYFGTRTHKQIEQIIRELKKTTYKDSKMTILSARDRTCIHPEASTSDNKNEACDELLKAEGGPACKFYKNSKMMSHYQPKTLLNAFDLEDFVKICKKMRACPYFGSRELLPTSDIVFCPYNYLVDPLIRSAMSINLKGSIIVMDEAHNIEDSARSAASGSFSLSGFEEGSINLEKVGRHSKTIRDSYLYFASIFKSVSKWLKDNTGNLSDYETFDSSSKVWSGNDMIAFLAYVKLGPDTFPEFRKRFEEILSEENDSGKEETIDMDKPKLIAGTLTVLKNLSQILAYMYKDDLIFLPDYRCVVMKTSRFGQRNSFSNRYAIVPANRYEITLNFWCLNPGVAFSDFKDGIHSLIVASGTLSPMASFQSELGIPFQITLEANHVVSKSQMWVGTIGKGPNNTNLTATYHNAATFSFQDDLGNLILQVCHIIPHGVLCFLPSYTLMDKLANRWQQTGLWDRLLTKKVVLCEPRKNQELHDIMTEFYSAIKTSESGAENGCNGALFFAVCRGKVSEGLDFADNNARAVITIGIPFPNIKDAQVDLKRKYNDMYTSEKQIMTGSDWYEIQAFRAINQALGRCIRHKNDFGALIIVDERFQKNNRYQNSLSKWIRKELEHFPSFSDAMQSLICFADQTGLRNLEDK